MISESLQVFYVEAPVGEVHKWVKSPFRCSACLAQEVYSCADYLLYIDLCLACGGQFSVPSWGHIPPQTLTALRILTRVERPTNVFGILIERESDGATRS